MTWDELQSEVADLSALVEDKPDIIVGIVRGGLVPARLLSSALGVKEMYCITVKKEEGERRVSSEITEDISGKRVLLVEDMLETGKSLDVARIYLESKGAIVHTAALYTMPATTAACDYSLRVVPEIITFPWEQR